MTETRNPALRAAGRVLKTFNCWRALNTSRNSSAALHPSRGEIDGYLLCGRWLWMPASLRAYRERQIAKGPQFGPAPTSKRKRSCPRKDRLKAPRRHREVRAMRPDPTARAPDGAATTAPNPHRSPAKSRSQPEAS